MPFEARRGTNISHWLSQSDKRGEARTSFFTEADVRRLGDWGFDHIRFPVDEVQLWDDADKPIAEGWDLLDAGLDWTMAAGMNAIVDLHILRSHYFNSKKEPPLFTDPNEERKFGRLWEQLSDRLRRRDVGRVAYELMNESVAANAEDWNRVAHTGHAAIRAREPGRTIVLGSNKWNQCQTFDQLKIPDDRKLLLTFHFYNPMLVTHYRAGWAGVGVYTGPVHYPGVQVLPEDVATLPDDIKAAIKGENRPYDRATMLRDMAKPLAVREATGLPLYCGEFGVHAPCPDDVRFRWYRDIISIFEQEQIGWGNWDYKGSFGLVDRTGKSTGVAETMLGLPLP